MLQHIEKDFEIATPFKNSLLISFFSVLLYRVETVGILVVYFSR